MTEKKNLYHLEPFIPEIAWRSTFQGFSIVDVAIRDRNLIYFLLRKEYPADTANSLWDFEIQSRLAVISLRRIDPAKRVGHQGLANFRMPRCGVSTTPLGQGLAVASNGSVYAMGSKHRGLEEVVKNGRTISLRKVRNLFGLPYAVGINREVFCRIDIGDWQRMSAGLPNQGNSDRPDIFETGFWDIDGFTKDDLYAVGGKGDVWHYDGIIWHPCQFPDKWQLLTVCCAKDGNVYITGEGGTVFKGQRDTWELVWQNDMTVPYNDSLWFDNKLWLASDYRLDVFENGVVDAAKYKGIRVSASGHMDVAEGILVIAGIEHVWLYDGESWQVLVKPYQV